MTSKIDLFGDVVCFKIIQETNSMECSEKDERRLREEISSLEATLEGKDHSKDTKEKERIKSEETNKEQKNEKRIKINKNKSIEKNNSTHFIIPRKKTAVVSNVRQVRPSTEATIARKSMTLRLLQHVLSHTDFKGNIKPSFYTDEGHAEFSKCIQKLKYGEYQQLFYQSLNDESHALKMSELNLKSKK